MKRFVHIMLAWLLVGIATAYAETPADLQALLIRASNGQAPLDYKLDAVVPKLRKVFQFQSYELIGSGSATITPPGETTIDLGKGHSLEIKLKREKGDRIKAEARWMQNGKVLVSTGTTMSGHQPLVLGGPKEGSATLIVTITVK
jgi:hypothetical protein